MGLAIFASQADGDSCIRLSVPSSLAFYGED